MTKEQEIFDLSNKYPEVRWIAQDEDGEWYSYRARPYLEDDCWDVMDDEDVLDMYVGYAEAMRALFGNV